MLAERAGDEDVPRFHLEHKRARRPREHKVEDRVDVKRDRRAESIRAHPAARRIWMVHRMVGCEHCAAPANHLHSPSHASAPHGGHALTHADLVADGELARELDGAVGQDDARVTTIADRRCAIGLETEGVTPLQAKCLGAVCASCHVGLDHFLWSLVLHHELSLPGASAGQPVEPGSFAPLVAVDRLRRIRATRRHGA